MNDRCGEPGCEGGHTDLATQHCDRDQLVRIRTTYRESVSAPGMLETVEERVVFARLRPRNCPACGHASFYRQCKCGVMLW